VVAKNKNNAIVNPYLFKSDLIEMNCREGVDASKPNLVILGFQEPGRREMLIVV
jgi:hypothetical protein